MFFAEEDYRLYRDLLPGAPLRGEIRPSFLLSRFRGELHSRCLTLILQPAVFRVLGGCRHERAPERMSLAVTRA